MMRIRVRASNLTVVKSRLYGGDKARFRCCFVGLALELLSALAACYPFDLSLSVSEE